jgi:hypothetical protein
MVTNRALEWTEVDAQTIEVATKLGSGRVAVRLEFDPPGDIVGTSAERPRPEGRKIVRRPWAGIFREYAVVGGVRIPIIGEVRWSFRAVRATFLRPSGRSHRNASNLR